MHTNEPIVLYFPQWQGSGLTNDVQTGAETLRLALTGGQSVEIPLSDDPLTTAHSISGYRPLVNQLETAKAVLERVQPDRILLIAGDCAAEIAPIAYLNAQYEGELTVLWLDAHADLNSPESSPSGHLHGMPVRLLLEGLFPDTLFQIDKRLSSQQILYVGLRETDAAEDAYITEHSLPVLADKGFSQQQVIDLLTQRNARNLYIHLDLDVLDPLQFPALLFPTPGGISVEALTQLIRQLIANYTVVGLSLTETTATKAEDLRPILPILEVYRQWLGWHDVIEND